MNVLGTEFGINRRCWLQHGLSSLGAAVASMRIGMRGICQASPDLQLDPGAKSIVCFFLEGGLTHLDSFDPKPVAPREIRGEFGTIATSVPGVHFSEHWPQLARLTDRITVMRSMHHRHNEHINAVRCMHAFKEDSDRRTPALGAILEWQCRKDLPQYMSIPSLRDFSGALGAEYQSYAATGAVGRYLQENEQDSSGMGGQRLSMLEQLQQLQKKPNEGKCSTTLLNQQQRVRNVLDSGAFRRIQQVSSGGDRDRQRFGTDDRGTMAMIARNAVMEGVRFVVVNFPGWDMHSGLFETSRKMMPVVDQAVSGLIQDLEESGRLETTLVLVISEFGRSPQIDTGGTSPGRGHWPRAMNLIVAGGSVPKGQVIGDTGPLGEESTAVRHTPDDLSATLYQWLGLDRDVFLPGEGARLNTAGAVIPELGIS